MTRTILPRVLAGYQRLGVGPDRLPKFAREQAMELHNRRVKDMRAESLELARQSFVTTWRIVKDEEPAPVAADQPAPMDKRRFETAPCYICGYNGPNYFQPATHRCAAEYQAVPPPKADPIRADQPAVDDAAVDHVSLGNAILCPSCDGRGEDGDEEGPTNQDCPRCHGHAWFYRHEYVADLRAKLAEADIVRAQRDALLQEEGERAASSVHHDSLVAQVADLRAKLEHATEEAARLREYAGSLEKGFSPNGDFVRAEVHHAARAEAAQWKERAEKAEDERRIEIQKRPAYLESAMWEVTSKLNAARAEADALRAERDALKARKVKLPQRSPTPCGLHGEGRNRGIDDCADAIRAAGVEVEG